MNSKLYIRNLSYSTTENELMALFALAGTVVLVDIIKDRLTGRSKGYGFILMSSPLAAENAVEMFNGHSLDNYKLRVGLVQQGDARGRFRDPGNKYSQHPQMHGGYMRYK